MICEHCHGTGWVWGIDKLPAERDTPGAEPCPSCGGSGVAHCCDGPVGLSGEITNRGGALIPQRFRR